jgi:hypothetical protein
MRPLSLTFAALAALTLATPAIAQDPSSAPEPAQPEVRREMLNTSQAQKAERQTRANDASQAEHDVAVGINAMEREHNAVAYDEALRQHDAQEQAYRAERKEWERKNPACWDGDAAKCPPAPGN